MSTVPNRIGKYEIQALLGRGGMGEVHKAYDSTLGRLVALKIMHDIALSQTNARERFIREAQAAGGLRHPNIVTVYDMGEFEGHLFIAMEFIQGEDLEHLIKKKAPLSMDDRFNVMIQVCDGIGYAHRHQIVHRDLKPSNIRIDDEGIAKIMDFGIARLEASNMTAAGTVMGTPYYMSPEQVRGMKVDARSDIFSIGAILYEVFAYKKAFEGDLASVFYKIVQEQPPPLSKHCSFPTEPLQKIVDRCLCKERTERLESCADLAQMLREAQEEYNKASDTATIQLDDLKAETTSPMVAPPAAITSDGRVATGSNRNAPVSEARTELLAPPASDAGSAPTQLMKAPTPPPAPTPAPPPVPSLQGRAPSEVTPPPSPTIAEAPVPGNNRTLMIVGIIVALLVISTSAFVYFRFFKSQPAAQDQPQVQSPTSEPVKPEPQPPVPPTDGSSQKLEQAKTLYQNGQTKEALAIYEELIQQNPENGDLYYLRGVVKKKDGKNEEAMVAFQKAVELDPKHAMAWQQLGILLMSRMDYHGSENAFQKSIEQKADSPASWEGLAQTYLMTQQTKKAEGAYDRLLELEPQNIAALYNVGQIRWANKNVKGAKDAFQRVLQINPNYAEAYNNLGAIYLSEGQIPQAIQANEKAIQLKPNLASAHYSLFLAFEQQREYKRAAEHLQKYVELTGDEDPALQEKLRTYSQ